MAQERNNVEERDRAQGERDARLVEGTVAGTGPVATGTEDHDDSEVLDLTADDDTPPEAEHLKGQIEETRKEMGETIDAIQDKLSFSNVSDQVSEHINNAVETAKEAVYDATIGKAANIMKNLSGDLSNASIVRQAKNNPFPFILIGLGAGLLVYQNYAGKGNGRTRRHEFTSGGDRRYGNQTSLTDTAGAKLSEMTDAARGKLSGVGETVSTAAGTAYNKVTGAVDTAYAGVGDVASRAYEKVGELRSTAVEQYDHHIDENPLAVGVVALALGAAVGMAIPATRYEGQLMGDARQDLLDKAQTTASHLLDRTKEVVSEAGRNMTEQAKANLTEH